MRKLEFSIEINAPKEKVWIALWEDQNYRNWTSAFMPGSYFESDLQQGSPIHFMSPDGNGMFGVVEEVVSFERMYFKHFGEIQNGEPQDKIYGDEATERYDLSESNGVTLLSVTLNTDESFIPYFADVFPKALQIVKQTAESHS